MLRKRRGAPKTSQCGFDSRPSIIKYIQANSIRERRLFCGDAFLKRRKVGAFFVSREQHVLDILYPAPRGWANPVDARASEVLTDAWDATPTEFFTSGATWMRLQFTYTRGAEDGAFDWQVESSIYSIAALVPTDAGEWADPSVEAVGAVVAGADTQNLVQGAYDTFTSQGAAAKTFTYGPILLGRTIERCRIPARESGDIQTPGQLAIVAELW